jgi:hypothetical protein
VATSATTSLTPQCLHGAEWGRGRRRDREEADLGSRNSWAPKTEFIPFHEASGPTGVGWEATEKCFLSGGMKVYVLAWKQNIVSNSPNQLWQPRISAKMSDGDINLPKLLLKLESSSPRAHNSSLIVKELIKPVASLLTEFYDVNFTTGQAKSSIGGLHCGLLAPDKRR